MRVHVDRETNFRLPVQVQVAKERPATDDQKLVGLKASLLIPGRGEPIKNGALVIDGPKIAWVGPQSSMPSKYRSITFEEFPVIMPGLWDCHTHFSGALDDMESESQSVFGSKALAGVRTAKELERALLAGFTTIREVGGIAGELTPAVRDGIIPGPNIYSSIGILGITGGHSDLHDLPIDVVRAMNTDGVSVVCDGITDCVRNVRLMIRRGANLIKICGTGGVGSLLDDPEDAQFSPEEIKAMVDEAARSKRIVAAHCHGKEGIMNALNAGVHTIEHGSYLDEEAAALMKKKGAIFVSTRLIIEEGLKNPKVFLPSGYRKLQKISEAHKRAFALAVKSGVKVVLGTDWKPGENGKELAYAVEAGMTSLEAIEASTARCPETLGSHFAPLSGQLKEGFDADVIAVASDPLINIKVLSDPKNVTHVWKGGKLYKGSL